MRPRLNLKFNPKLLGAKKRAPSVAHVVQFIFSCSTCTDLETIYTKRFSTSLYLTIIKG